LAEKKNNLEGKTMPHNSKTTKKVARGQNRIILIVGVLDLNGLGVKGEIRQTQELRDQI
jgi:hypothetical protein